ncbi:unnamed protein product [Onchocerca flexuosa]|uniref:PCRF domain-containing protein n=1 Tax=Onchocerca flexuosa TaxID=387005 RepID=A0A183HG06_9BILA|nr:unnamed protein product [Onchocerca flexuosa]
MVLKKDEITRLHAAYEQLKEKEGCTDLSEDEQMENEIMLKCAVKDIDDAIQAYESLESKRKEINVALAELSRNEPRECPLPYNYLELISSPYLTLFHPCNYAHHFTNYLFASWKIGKSLDI